MEEVDKEKLNSQRVGIQMNSNKTPINCRMFWISFVKIIAKWHFMKL